MKLPCRTLTPTLSRFAGEGEQSARQALSRPESPLDVCPRPPKALAEAGFARRSQSAGGAGHFEGPAYSDGEGKGEGSGRQILSPHVHV
jgi:hypothetical protein